MLNKFIITGKEDETMTVWQDKSVERPWSFSSPNDSDIAAELVANWEKVKCEGEKQKPEAPKVVKLFTSRASI